MGETSGLDIVAMEATPEARRTLYAALRLAGFSRIRLATSVAHARALGLTTRPDVVIVDIGAQRREGLSLDAIVRQLNPDPPKEEAPEAASNKYGLDASSVTGFAGDLDELLGDGPASGPSSRGGGSGAPIPVMLLCEKPTMSVVELARASGIVGVLLKPMEPKMTAARVKAAAARGRGGAFDFRAA